MKYFSLSDKEIKEELQRIDEADQRGKIEWISFEDEIASMDRQLRSFKKDRIESRRRSEKRLVSAQI